MFNIILVAPEIPPNTGNIIRLAANTGSRLRLVEPLGFSMDDAALRRAGLDYHEYADIRICPDWTSARNGLPPERCFAVSVGGTTRYDQTTFRPDDSFVFGCEGRGLPADILAEFPPERILRLPMRPHNRSLNLSNAVAVVIYEAWRQNLYSGGL